MPKNDYKLKAPFRQELRISGHSALKKPVIKKLIKKLKALYPAPDAETWAEIFPKGCKVTEVKLRNKARIYYVKPKVKKEDQEDENEDEKKKSETIPVFFSPTSKDKENVYPTVFTMWKYPKMVKAFYVHHHICQYIFRGADLMLPGVSPTRSEFEGVETGMPRCVKVIGNDYPIAIGWSILPEKEIRSSQMRGRGLKVLHCYRDELFQKFKTVELPNEGFKKKVVLPIGDIQLSAEELAQLPDNWEETDKKIREGGGDAWSDGEENEDPSDEDFSDDSDGSPSKKEKRAQEAPSDPAAPTEPEKDSPVAEPAAEESEAEESSEEEEKGPETKEEKAIRVLEMTLLTVSKPDLPISGSDLIDRMREIEDVDVKSTKWRKIAKFLKEMQKLKLVEAREKKGKVSLIAVKWDHPALVVRKQVGVRNSRLEKCFIDDKTLRRAERFLNTLVTTDQKADAAAIQQKFCKKFKRKAVEVGGPSVMLDYFFGGASEVVKLGPNQALAAQLGKSVPPPARTAAAEDAEEDASDLLWTAFMTAIKEKVDDDYLPVSSNELYNDLVLGSLPPDVKLQMKQTKWKTFTAFLKDEEKAGIITLQPDKYNGEGVAVGAINRNHPEYVEFFASEEDLEPPPPAKEDGAAENFGSVQIMARFKPNGRLGPIFEQVKDHDPKSLYTKNELKTFFRNWLRRQPELRVPNDNLSIRVTELIYRVLLKPKKEKNKLQGWKNHAKTVRLAEVFQRFDRECQQYTAIVLPGKDPKFVFGPIPKITFTTEKRSGGKNKKVTHITGLENYGLDPKEFASTCSKKFACSTTAQNLPGKDRKGKKEVKIQGDMVRQLMEFLSDPLTYNIPTRFMEFKE